MIHQHHNSSKAQHCIMVVLLLALASGCSFIFESKECQNNGDCANRGEGLVCSQQLCVLPPPRNDADVAGDSDIEGGLLPSDLLNENCTAIYMGETEPIGATSDEPIPSNAIIIGSILPLSGFMSMLGPTYQNVIALGIKELNSQGGLLGRPFVVVACDSGSESEIAIASAEHLVNEVGVQAILGPFLSEVIIDVFNEVLRDTGVVTVTNCGISPAIDCAFSNGMILRTQMSQARGIRALSEIINDSENFDFSRIAILYLDNPTERTMKDTLQLYLCPPLGTFNCTDENAYRTFSITDGTDETEVSLRIAEVADFEPDAVVIYADQITVGYLLQAASELPGTPIRSFLFDYQFALGTAFLIIDSSIFPSLCQVLGVSSIEPSGFTYDSFVTAYNSEYGSNPINWSSNIYDAVYLLAYSIAAATRESDEFTGTDIANAFGRLSDGPSVISGISGWSDGVNELRRSSTTSIDYVGASGDIDIDMESECAVLIPVAAYRLNIERRAVDWLGIVFDEAGRYQAPSFSSVSDSECTEIHP